MISKNLTIINKLGLHARAASEFVKTASRFESSIQVTNPHKKADGKSIMSVMMLQASCGSDVEICVVGNDETEAMSAIEALINSKFGEAE